MVFIVIQHVFLFFCLSQRVAHLFINPLSLLCFFLCGFVCGVSQMAYRLMVRRIWNLPVKDLRCPHLCAPTLLPRSTSPALSRPLSVTARQNVSFSVQDHEDFTERVINSNLPVLVDFHAQCVSTLGRRSNVDCLDAHPCYSQVS